MALIHSERSKKWDRSMFMVMISWAVMFPLKSCGYPDNQWDRSICAVFGRRPVPHQLITPTIPALGVLLSAEMQRGLGGMRTVCSLCSKRTPLSNTSVMTANTAAIIGNYPRDELRFENIAWAPAELSTEWREWSRHCYATCCHAGYVAAESVGLDMPMFCRARVWAAATIRHG